MTDQTLCAPGWVQTLCADLRLAGETRLADALLRLPSEVMNGRLNRVAAIAPKTLAAVKNMRHPWLELYVRHWALTCRLAVAGEGETALAEAWSLTELSLRPDVRDCPQALSIISNLVGCHSNMDGPGKGPDCLDLCVTTLGVTKPADAEFVPLTLALARIRMDTDDFAAAVSCLQDAGQRSVQDTGNETPAFAPYLALSLHRSGQSRQALAVLRPFFSDANRSGLSLAGGPECRVYDTPPGLPVLAAAIQARIVAEAEGDVNEAWRILPHWNEVIPALYEPWTAAAYAVALRRTESNTWELGALFQAAISHARAMGAHYTACRIAYRHARLAIARKSAWTAARALAQGVNDLPLLRAPGNLPEEFEACAQDLAALPEEKHLPVTASSLLAYCASRPGPRNPEKDIVQFRLGLSKRPGDTAMILAIANAMQACRAFDEALGLLRTAVEEHPGDADCFSALLTLLMQQKKTAEIDALAASFAPHHPDRVAWCLAFAAYDRGEWALAIEQALQVVRLAPDARHARRLLAEAAMQQKDFTLARDQFRELCRDVTPPTPDHWDLMTAAAAAEDWKTVRKTARALNLDPISAPADDENSEDWGLAQLYFFEEGEWRGFLGRRTSPVTAKILAVAPPPLPQHVNELVVFAAHPLQLDGKNAPASAPAFRVVHTLQAGNCTPWPACGADPGPALRAELRDALYASGITLWGETPENYRVRDPHNPDGEGLPGLNLFVIVPDTVPAEEADALLQQLTSDWPHPLCWPELAEAAGADTAPHYEAARRYAV